jgi:hypothetical protein
LFSGASESLPKNFAMRTPVKNAMQREQAAKISGQLGPLAKKESSWE